MAADPAAAALGPEREPPPPPRPLSIVSALPFWFYLTAAVSLLALLLPHLLSPHASPPLPPLLRRHLSDGRLLKLHPGPDLFAFTSRPAANSAHHHPVLVLPGLAAGSFSFRRLLSSLSSRGLVAAAIDLPGQGLSPPPPAPPPRTNPLREIMDRGIFHAFEHLVETGEVPFQEGAPEASHSFYAAAEAAAAAARAVDALGLAPVHLVIHDSALAAGGRPSVGQSGGRAECHPNRHHCHFAGIPVGCPWRAGAGETGSVGAGIVQGIDASVLRTGDGRTRGRRAQGGDAGGGEKGCSL
ncbi:hypothetical protein ACQ4PT_006217 [Festuca glaucescens]